METNYITFNNIEYLIVHLAGLNKSQVSVEHTDENVLYIQFIITSEDLELYNQIHNVNIEHKLTIKDGYQLCPTMPSTMKEGMLFIPISPIPPKEDEEIVINEEVEEPLEVIYINLPGYKQKDIRLITRKNQLFVHTVPRYTPKPYAPEIPVEEPKALGNLHLGKGLSSFKMDNGLLIVYLKSVPIRNKVLVV